MTKRVLCAVIAVLMLMSLAGCGTGNGKEATTPKDIIEIDYFQSINMDCTGVSSSGTVSMTTNIEYIQYDKSNPEITAFLQSIKPKINKTEFLKNGDLVTVSLSYSYAEAERLGILLKSTGYKFYVHGLYGVGSVTDSSLVNISSIHQNVLKTMRDDETLVSTYYQYKSYFSPSTEKTVRVMSDVVFIVTNGTHYYSYSIGIGSDGDSLGDYVRNYGKAVYNNWTSEADVYNDMCEQFGEEDLEKIS